MKTIEEKNSVVNALTELITSDIVIITEEKTSVNYKKMKGGEIIKMQNLKVDGEKVRLIMARNTMNPYDLCSGAQISYASYRRIMKEGNCKIATLGKIANALGVDVTEILVDSKKVTVGGSESELNQEYLHEPRKRRRIPQNL